MKLRIFLTFIFIIMMSGPVFPAVQLNEPEPKNSFSQKININTDDEQELMKLHGIGKKKAKNIIEYRQKYGNFTNVEQIKEVSGISNNIFNKNYDIMVVE